MTRDEKGSATLHSLFAAVLLVAALAAAILWSTISTARHKLATAADLTALSAAQSLTTASDTTGAGETASGATGSTTPCATAARIAALHKVDLIACHPAPTSVAIQVALELHLPFSHPTLTTTARAGPL